MFKQDDNAPATKGDLQTFFSAMQKEMATKKELSDMRKEMATKKELNDMRKEMATKSELIALRKDMATKEDIKNMATKEDIKNMATKDDLHALRKDMYSEMQRLHADSIHLLEVLFENLRIDFQGSYGDEIAWVKDVQKGHSKRISRLEEKVGV